MPSDARPGLGIPALVLGIGAGWLATSLLAAPRAYGDWGWHAFWLLGLGTAALWTLAARRLDRAGVVAALAVLLAGLVLVAGLAPGEGLLGGADVLAPLAVVGVGGLALGLQLRARSRPAAGAAGGGDPLRRPCDRNGCLVAGVGLSLAAVGAVSMLANGLAMEAAGREADVSSAAAAIAGLGLAVLGAALALGRGPAAARK